MRWVASLVALGLMMALFHRFTAAGPVEARATLALGSLLLAAYLGGDLARHLRLPRLTGYLIIGFAVGPSWLGLVRADELDALGFLADAGLAVIALVVGSELDLERLRADRPALARLAAGAVLFPVAVVSLVVMTVAPWFPITVHQPFGDAITVALVLGVIAATSSPVVALPLVRDSGARGPFARTVLDLTVVQDVAALLLFALTLLLGRAASSPGALDLGVARAALAQLAGSVAGGAASGFILGQYVRRLPRTTPLLVIAVALVAATVAWQLHLEVLLVALAAGFYLRNYAPAEGERLRTALEQVLGPVSVAYFALAGAGISIAALGRSWSWVLLLVGLRVVSLRYGLRWAGRAPAVTPVMARHGWLGLIPQAGLALGLATLARRAFPEWGVSLEGLVLAMIGVHLVAGPLCFRLGLRLAGEVTEGGHVAEQPGAPGPVVVAHRSRL
ncbi:MAG: cation:proton antiporter [Gemmatimonadetes bacterium]|nr:cation:proton antiporter [Gemmatimonadota bacterium]